MRKVSVFFFLLCAIIVFAVLYRTQAGTEKTISSKYAVQNIAQEGKSPSEQYLFVPYWTLDRVISEAPFDTLIYFGIEGGTNGISKTENGYQGIQNFVDFAGDKEKLVTVRMLDFESNAEILRSENLQKKIITESVLLAKDYGFQGIVLDLEMQGLPFESLMNRITQFHKNFSKEAASHNLEFGTLIYGDVYYRLRPYDVQEIGKTAQRVYVMSYDFSKSRGDPGPNFPLSGATSYGYDFKTMVTDFKKEVPISKLTFVFGMFGYTWPVDESGKSTGVGVARTTLQMERFITGCVNDVSCTVRLDPLSNETQVVYTEDNEKKIAWFETDHSTQKKIEYLNSEGIRSIAWWAYSYF